MEICISYNQQNFQYKVNRKTTSKTYWNERKYVKNSLKQTFKKLDAEAFFKYMANIVDSTITRVGVPLKNINFKLLIDNLKKSGYKIALATAATKERMKNLFKKVNLNSVEIFDEIVCAEDVKIGKPNPEIYVAACKKLNLAPQNCFAIEDSPNGIMSAHSAGCRPIMVIDLIKPNLQTKAICEKVFKKLDKAIDYILKEHENPFEND